jgi:hypothetical protein
MGFAACRRCTGHRRIAGVADLIVPLVYAIAGTESAALLRGYKNHPSGAVRLQYTDEITCLVQSVLSRHEDCLAAKIGMPITVRTTIPSLTYRPGIHPFTTVVNASGVTTAEVLVPGPSATCHRIVTADKFAVSSTSAVAGRHVLVLDDLWTTGSNAQSAAVVLRAAGASAISVMVVGRWLNPTYPTTKAFIDRYLHAGFDPRQCPLTGGACAPTPASTGR